MYIGKSRRKFIAGSAEILMLTIIFTPAMKPFYNVCSLNVNIAYNKVQGKGTLKRTHTHLFGKKLLCTCIIYQ